MRGQWKVPLRPSWGSEASAQSVYFSLLHELWPARIVTKSECSTQPVYYADLGNWIQTHPRRQNISVSPRFHAPKTLPVAERRRISKEPVVAGPPWNRPPNCVADRKMWSFTQYLFLAGLATLLNSSVDQCWGPTLIQTPLKHRSTRGTPISETLLHRIAERIAL